MQKLLQRQCFLRYANCSAFLVVVVATATVPPAMGAFQINDNPAGGGLGVQNFRITPDSARVVYRGELNSAGISELFSASTTSTDTQIQINTPSTVDGEISGGFQIAPDGETLVFIGDLLVAGAFELFSASASVAESEVKFSDTPSDTDQMDVGQAKLTADGLTAIYRADLDVNNNFELYSATVGAAGTQVRLTNTPDTNGDVSPGDYFPTADGTRVVFHGDLESDTVDEIFSAPIGTAGMQIKLNTASPFGGDIDDEFLITPDSSRVIFLGQLETPAVRDLYSAPTDGSAPQIKLNGPHVSGNSGVNNNSYRLTPDGSRVMYTGVLDTADTSELYSAPTDMAGMQIKLNNSPVAGGDVGGQRLTADGSRAVFDGDLLVLDQTDLFSAPIDMAGMQIQLNTNTAGGDVTRFLLSEDGSRVVYSGDMITAGQRELYSAVTDTAGTQLTLTTNPLGDDGGIGNFEISPDGTRVAYTGVYTTTGIFDLYVASTTTEGTQVALTNITGSANVFNFDFSPDGSFVVFDVDTDGNFTPDTLFAADSLGQNPAFQINDPIVTGGQITTFTFTPDSQNVLYRANQDDLGIFNLYSASLTAAEFTADFDNDGDVDDDDLRKWEGDFGINADSDADADGDSDGADFLAWQQQNGSGVPTLASSRAVPEPSTSLLLISSWMLIVHRLRTRGFRRV